MTGQLLIFAGFPKRGLHAGGLQFAVEEVENLAILEHDPVVQYRKEGVFAITDKAEELLYPVEYRMSDLCLREGITWDWFPEHWTFGNGVTIHKTSASYELKEVVHGTQLSQKEYIKQASKVGVRIPGWQGKLPWNWGLRHHVRLGNLELEVIHQLTEGWEQYEARWMPGTCPQENHIVHLTWLVTTHRLPSFAYDRLRELIENPTSQPKEPWRYSQESGKHFSTIRQWDGSAAQGVMVK